MGKPEQIALPSIFWGFLVNDRSFRPILRWDD